MDFSKNNKSITSYFSQNAGKRDDDAIEEESNENSPVKMSQFEPNKMHREMKPYEKFISS